jgi:hypothetical protein
MVMLAVLVGYAAQETWNQDHQDQISLPLQHIKWHAQHILNNTNPADDDDEITLKLQTMKPLAKILNVRAPLERIGDVLDAGLQDFPGAERSFIVKSVTFSTEFNTSKRSISYDAYTKASLLRYYVSSLRHRDGTVSVSLMCGGLEFEVAQIVEFEEITRRWSEPYQCNCTQPMFKCRCHETEPKCGWWVHFGCTQYWQCDECPGERVCTMCTRETVTKERIPRFKPNLVTPEQFKGLFDEAVRAVARQAALL